MREQRFIDHELKCWPDPFRSVQRGKKRFEIRSTLDRNFQVGETVRLEEWCPKRDDYTGQWWDGEIIYVAAGTWGLPPNICVFGISCVPEGLNERFSRKTRVEELELRENSVAQNMEGTY